MTPTLKIYGQIESHKIEQNFDAETVVLIYLGGAAVVVDTRSVEATIVRSQNMYICHLFRRKSVGQRPISRFQRITIRSNAATLYDEIRFGFHSIDTRCCHHT